MGVSMAEAASVLDGVKRRVRKEAKIIKYL